MEEENKNVTRRKFIEDSSKKALTGTAAVFLGLGMIKPKAVHAAACWFDCAGGCEGDCIGSCGGDCTASCTGESMAAGCWFTCDVSCEENCAANCHGSCSTSCTGECIYDCTGEVIGGTTGRSASEVECGTPVSERTSSTRHVTA